MKQLLLAFAFSGISLSATVVNFSDSVDVILHSSPSSITLDSSPYMNTIIGGPWDLVVTSSTVQTLNISHYIFLFGSGSLDTIKVYGIPQLPGALTVIANPGIPSEQSFTGAAGTLPNEYIFNLNGYDLHQGGETLISGFNSITTINFAGAYTVVPEPSTMLLAGMAAMSLLLHRRRN